MFKIVVKFTVRFANQLNIDSFDGQPQVKPTLIKRLKSASVTEIACGWNFSLAVGIDGAVYAFGKSDDGQCGVESFNDQLLPRKVRRRVCFLMSIKKGSFYFCVEIVTYFISRLLHQVPDFLCSSAIACGFFHVVAVARDTHHVYRYQLILPCA
mgnify:CR=1 FL=1